MCMDSLAFVADSLVYLVLCLTDPKNIRGANVFSRYRQASESNRRVDLVRLCPDLEELGFVQVSRDLAKPISHLTLMYPRVFQVPDCVSGSRL